MSVAEVIWEMLFVRSNYLGYKYKEKVRATIFHLQFPSKCSAFYIGESQIVCPLSLRH